MPSLARQTSMVVVEARILGNSLATIALMWAATMKAIPVSGGSSVSNSLYACRAPADPPMPTMKLGTAPLVLHERSPPHRPPFLRCCPRPSGSGLLLPRIVRRVDVVDVPRPDPVKLDHGLALGPGEVLHARRHKPEGAGGHLVAGLLV